ncbi:MAG TPA: hypothetical protein VNU44_10845 [Bryobacteraceae bacterium]|nr:hypothetical protein [Bryobacteraceae bacterium]
MNPIMITNAQFYFALGVPLVGILVNVVLFTTLSHRIDRLEDRVHTGHDLLIGKVGEIDVRLARLEERSSK